MFHQADAPWKPLPDSGPDHVLLSESEDVVFAPPASLPALLQDAELDTWRWMRVDLATGASETRAAAEVSVAEVLDAVGAEHREFVADETRRAVRWLEDSLGSYVELRLRDEGDAPRREVASEAIAAAERLRTELRQAGLLMSQ